MRRATRIRLGLVLMGALVLSMAGLGCKKDEPAPASAPAATPAAKGSEAKPETPEQPSGYALAPSAEEAFQRLFDALREQDYERAAGQILSTEECLALTGQKDRCTRVALQRKEFLEAVSARPIPKDAQIAQIRLEKTLALQADEKDLARDIRIQPGVIRFLVGEDMVTLANIAAIELEGGWRVVPGRRRDVPPGKPGAAGQPAPPATPPATAQPPAAAPAPPAE